MKIMDKKKSNEETIKLFASHPADKMIAEMAIELARNGGIGSDQNEKKETSTKEDARQEKLLALKMAKEKEIIDVKEFELIYGYSKSAQKSFRSRLNDPLLYIQKGFRSKIMYKKSVVEEWLKANKR